MLVLAALWFSLAAIIISFAAHAGTICTKLGGGLFCQATLSYVGALLALIFFAASAFAITQSGLRTRTNRSLISSPSQSGQVCCKRDPEALLDESSRLLTTTTPLGTVSGAMWNVMANPNKVRRSRCNKKSPVMIPLAALPFRRGVFTIPLRMNGRKNYQGLSVVTTDYRLLTLARLENRL
jgi:hypothetical protein